RPVHWPLLQRVPVKRRALAAAFLFGVVSAPACSGDDAAPEVRVESLADLVLSQIEPSLVLPGTDIRVRGSFPSVVERLELRIDGTLDGAPLTLRVPLTRDGDTLKGSWPASAPRGSGILLGQ